MTVGDALALAAFVLPPAHLLIRRFQYFAFRSVLAHIGLFFVSCWPAAGHAAGWAEWLTIPALAVTAAASQYVFTRDSRAARAKGP